MAAVAMIRPTSFTVTPFVSVPVDEEILETPSRERLVDSERYRYLTGITPFEKFMIDSANDVTSRMMRDDLIGYMHSWADYCEMEDPNFYKVRVPTAEELAAAALADELAAVAAAEPPAPPAPTEFNLADDEASAAARQRECEAWLAVPRNKRRPYSMGTLQGGNCMNKEDSLVIKGIPQGVKTLYGDLRAYFSEIGAVVDIYKPERGPLFIGFQNSAGLREVLEQHRNGLLYKGATLHLERAMSRSKTSAEMASKVSV
jgi:hypothetical protein